MGIRAWLRRSKNDGGEQRRVEGTSSATRRRSKPADQRLRASREEPYSSEFIARYGDPSD